MKDLRIVEDARIRPKLFQWNGGIEAASLRAWLDQNRWLGRVPEDLKAFWQETGGGDALESETLLGPRGDPSLGDDLAETNREMRARGMPEKFVVFHRGMATSAADTEAGDYVELAPDSFEVVRRFASFDDWYKSTLRAEYGQRYKLPGTDAGQP